MFNPHRGQILSFTVTIFCGLPSIVSRVVNPRQHTQRHLSISISINIEWCKYNAIIGLCVKLYISYIYINVWVYICVCVYIYISLRGATRSSLILVHSYIIDANSLTFDGNGRGKL